MKIHHHQILSTIGLLIVACFLLSNAAMPGFFNVGGSGAFVPLYQEDSIHLEKIQMQEEEINILLYKGFAAVKGEYYMRNLSQDTVSLKTGYPINGLFENEQVYAVYFRDLYQLKVLENDRLLSTNRPRIDSLPSETTKLANLRDSDNWYTWQGNYAADTLTKITVYFMVNTNEARLREGYSGDDHNGFTYILESGRAWAKNIEKGQIRIQLSDDLALSDLKGIAPVGQWKANEKTKQLLWEFSSKEPKSTDNVLVRYTEASEDFDFSKHEKKAEKYYQLLDDLSKQNTNLSDFKPFEAKDFEVHDWKSAGIMYVVMFLVVFGMPLAIILLGLLTLWYFVFKKKKTKAQ